jgi:UDP-4-amino-4,6-dideoxy-N-acetyl-beta-L-altrosamine transaminase
MTEKNIPYGKQNITKSDLQAVSETLLSDYLTQGPKIAEFEQQFSNYCKAKYTVMVANGTAALHLAAMALDVKQGDKVITTPITFVASANGFRYCGAEIVFCDIDPETFLLDLDKLENLLKSAPTGTYKGVVPVDFAGYPIHAERLRNIANRYGLWIVEDACHAPGGYFIDNKNQKEFCGACNYADMTVFSFHPVKHIATGEGGAITTNRKDLYDKLNLFRTHGITKNPDLMEENHGGWYMEMIDLGYNYRITDFQAALGIEQLKRLDWSIARRQEIAKRYNDAFDKMPEIIIPKVSNNIRHAYHLYIIQVEDRKGLYDFLRTQNIFAQVHYIPAHLMPYYKQFGWKKGDMPVAEKYYEHCLSLPMYPTLTDEEQDFVITSIKTFIQ